MLITFRFVPTAMVILFLGTAALADEAKVEHKVGGTLQTLLSYQAADSTNFGFGLRRIRVRWFASVNSKFKSFIQADLVSNSLAGRLVDARLEYHFSDQFNIQAGRFVGAGVHSGALTAHAVIDIVERSFTANNWAGVTVGADYRDFGLQAEGKSKSGEFTGRLWIHNGSGSMNVINTEGTLATAEFSPSAIDAMVIYQPKSVNGLEVGGHYGLGNKDIKDFNSYSSYLYFEPGPLRLKAEMIGWTLKRVSGDVKTLGYYAFGGYQVTDNVELVGRFEIFDPNRDVNEDGTSFITLGVVFKEIAGKINHKLTAAIVLPGEQGQSVDNTTAYAMWQLVF